jgi:hypothetical protein
MLHSPLDNIALAYEPVWDKGRRICATRLTVHAVEPKRWTSPSADLVTDGRRTPCC